MISGALLLGSGSGESLGQFYRRRLTRVGIPLVVWHVVYFAWREWGLHEHLDAHVVVRDVLTTRTYQALFFFWIIVGLYLVTPVLRAFVTVAARRDVAWFAGGAVVWMWAVAAGSRVLAHLHVTASPWNPPALVLFLPYIGYFLLGHVLRDVLVGRRALAGLVAVLVLCEVFLPWSYVHSADHPRLSLALTWGYQDLPAAASAICVFMIARSVIGPRSRLAQEPSRRRARRLGDLTFGVFLVHLLLLGLLTTQFPGIGRDMESRLEVALAVWALVLVTSFVVSAALARVPLLRRTVGA
jgi:surface polysaccharide O-acyltransferase-like enzyme